MTLEVFTTKSLPGRTVQTEGGDIYRWFSGTDYLGMGNHEGFREHLLTGINKYGMHFGSSRNNSLRLHIYNEAEVSFAEFVKAEFAILVSSGMWAGQLVMKEIRQIVLTSSTFSKIEYHYAPGSHPAIWGPDYCSNAGTSWEDWAIGLAGYINSGSKDIAHVICSDAIGSPMVRQFDFSLFDRIDSSLRVWFVIDQSHSLGVTGSDASGIRSAIPARHFNQTIFVSSLNKALGVPAGAIWGSRQITGAITVSPFFAGASPPAPAYIYAFQQLLNAGTYPAVFTELKANIQYFNGKLGNVGTFLSIEDYPVFCSQHPELFNYLLKNQIMASCFAYPSPADKPVTRLAISALHKKEDLDLLAEVCSKFFL